MAKVFITLYVLRHRYGIVVQVKTNLRENFSNFTLFYLTNLLSHHISTNHLSLPETMAQNFLFDQTFEVSQRFFNCIQ